MAIRQYKLWPVNENFTQGDMMATYEHGGVAIQFNEARGEFLATINGKLASGASLAGIKKKIDAAAASAFKPFSALASPEWGNKKDHFIEVKVVGIVRGRKVRYGANKDSWETDTGRHFRSLMADTPENRAAIIEYHNLVRLNIAAYDAMKEAERECGEKIKKIEPGQGD